jgi:hypothetical protein
MSYKQIVKFNSNPEAQAYFHEIKAGPIVDFFRIHFDSRDGETPEYVQRVLALTDLETKLIDAVDSETFTAVVKYCGRSFWHDAPEGLYAIIIDQIVRNLIIKLDFEEQTLINILDPQIIDRIRDVITKYERNLGVFLSVNVKFGSVSWEVGSICDRGPIEVKLHGEDSSFSSIYVNLKDFSKKYLLRKQVEIDVYASCGCSHDDGQLKLYSRSIKRLSPKLELRSNYGGSSSRGDVIFIDPFYHNLCSSPELPAEMLAELQDIEPRYRYSRGWHFCRTDRNDPICINASIMNESYAAYTPSYYLNSENRLKADHNEFILARDRLGPDLLNEDDQIQLTLIKSGLKEFIRMSSNAERARRISDTHFMYPLMTCCLDLMVLHHLLSMVSERVIIKFARLLPMEIFPDGSPDLSSRQILNILKHSPDYTLRNSNLKALEAQKIYDVPVTKPENWCMILRYDGLWISTSAAALRYEMYNFLARILYWELGFKFIDILDRETPITLSQPEVLNVI